MRYNPWSSSDVSSTLFLLISQTAQYVVDEQPMEIAIRLPADYPLHGVEVKDVRRVGVTEAKWRAWLLAVQQVVTSRDGLVLDALTLFKRNVSLHFAGVVDCAIVR